MDHGPDPGSGNRNTIVPQDGTSTTAGTGGSDTTVTFAGRSTTATMRADANGDTALGTPNISDLAQDMSLLKAQMESLTSMMATLLLPRIGPNQPSIRLDDQPLQKSADSSSSTNGTILAQGKDPIPIEDKQSPEGNDVLEVGSTVNTDDDVEGKPPQWLPKQRTTIDKFDPNSNLPARLWMELFETEFEGAASETMVRFLATYLTKDGLRWFAQFIAPKRKVYPWAKVKELFFQKFARDEVNPLVAAKDRMLKPNESIQSYFDEKSRLLELAEVSTQGTIGLLSDGVPETYRALLIARNPQTVSEWLYCAQLFESSKKPERRSVNVAQVPKALPKLESRTGPPDFSKPPPTPCPRCLETSGIHSYHWARNCSLPRTNGPNFNKPAPTDSLNSKGGPSRA